MEQMVAAECLTSKQYWKPRLMASVSRYGGGRSMAVFGTRRDIVSLMPGALNLRDAISAHGQLCGKAGELAQARLVTRTDTDHVATGTQRPSFGHGH
jgi:hypothetical protein